MSFKEKVVKLHRILGFTLHRSLESPIDIRGSEVKGELFSFTL